MINGLIGLEKHVLMLNYLEQKFKNRITLRFQKQKFLIIIILFLHLFMIYIWIIEVLLKFQLLIKLIQFMKI